MKIKSKKSEFDHFSDLASKWWSKNGEFKTLHEINPIRIQFVLETLKKTKLNKLKILDLGCGGGLVCEELAKLGANVTGVDFVEKNIKVAKLHAIKNNLKINYLVKNFEKENINSKFDVIIIFEVLEHLDDWESFLYKIRSNLKPKGILIISTINKNLISKFLTIDLAENFLRLIPANTHNYYKFIKPEDINSVLANYNFTNLKLTGLIYDPFKLKWRLGKNTKVNYFCSYKIN